MIDAHLRILLSATEAVPLHTAVEDGLNAASELRNMIRNALRGGSGEKDHPLYEKVRGHIEMHPVPWQERYTRNALYFVELFGEFLAYTLQEYQNELEERIRVNASLDPIRLQENRRKLCELLGGETEIEQLENLFQSCFLQVMPVDGFLQGLTFSLLSELLSRDEESSRLIFQMALDSGTTNDA